MHGRWDLLPAQPARHGRHQTEVAMWHADVWIGRQAECPAERRQGPRENGRVHAWWSERGEATDGVRDAAHLRCEAAAELDAIAHDEVRLPLRREVEYVARQRFGGRASQDVLDHPGLPFGTMRNLAQGRKGRVHVWLQPVEAGGET